MSVDLYFAAPLIVQDVDPAIRETIRRKVYAYLESEKAKRDVTPAPEESVSTSYYRREASILDDAGLDELEALIRSTAKSYLEGTLKLRPRELEIQQAWINLFEPGSQEGQHTHHGSLLSCSYYVDAPKDCGCIVFPDPIGARQSYREFTSTSGSELLNRSDIAVEPQPGRFVMFESWMPHYIQCNKSDKVRISIAINLREATRASVAGPPHKTDQVPTAAPHDIGEASIDHPSRSGRPVDAADRGDTRAADAESSARSAQSSQFLQSSDFSQSVGRPFLFNDLFEINTELNLERRPIQDTIPVLVIDNLLHHPGRVREVIGRTPATNWKHEPGGRNFVDYYDCRLRFPIRYPNTLIGVAQQAISRIYNVNTRPADPSVDVNWFMQINEKRADFAVPHSDITENVTRSFTCVLFLNNPEECSGGTAFFRFKPTNSLMMDDGYARAVRDDPRIGETGIDYWPEATEQLWERLGTVDMAPGRLVVFPSEYFHAAYHPENSFYEFPRLTLAYWMIA